MRRHTHGDIISLRCPLHPNQEIGLARCGCSGSFDFGFWCIKCGRHIFLDEEDIKKCLTSGIFPVCLESKFDAE